MLHKLLTLPRRRLVVKITGLSVALVALTIVYFGLETYDRERWLNQARFGKGLQRIAQVAALSVVPADMRAAGRAEDDAAARRLGAWLVRVRATAELGPTDGLYLLRVPDAARFAAITEDEAALDDSPAASLPLAVAEPTRPAAPGLAVPIAPDARAAVWRAVVGRDSSYSSLYQRAGGEAISAYAAIVPVETADGAPPTVVGLLVAEQDLSEVFEARWGIFWDVILRSLGVVALAVLLGGFLARGIGRALQRIRAGAQAIKNQDYAHRVDVRRGDELGMVAEQFNEMADTLAQRVQLLKFLPAYTLEAAIRRTRGQTLDVEALDGSILFSDIRGYTTLSVGLAVERVVEMLNVYLRCQAEVLARHGGVIDKFIGDAVLGVFMGPDHTERAVACGLEIQREVIAMNARYAFDFPINVGIGVATGSLVLAEVGSDERRERTLIGSVVNLASRLCSRAAAQEVLVGDGVRQVLGARLGVARTDQVELKGFSGLQTVHAVESLAGNAS